jgi:hypothetical protein
MDSGKNNEIAEKYKAEGNEHFKNSNYKKSELCYSLAISKAEEGSNPLYMTVKATLI